MDAIVFKNISKKYSLVNDRPLLIKNLFRSPKRQEIWALKNVSFTIKKGETIGIIGENGSGKSTILKIVAGITTPTKGNVLVNGRVASLIELGAGFHQDLTGKENVYLNGTLLGLTKGEIDKRYKDIVDFADIGEYIDQPVRTYSSGMTVRLGFSVAIHLDPEILLVDEVLAVGDEEFQRKCISSINRIRADDKTILLVSHNLRQVVNVCSKAIWISHGQLRVFGNTEYVIRSYINEVERYQQLHPDFLKRWGNGDSKVTETSLVNENGRKISTLTTEDKISIRVKVKFYKNISNPVFGIIIRNSEFQDIFSIHTRQLEIETGDFKKGEIRSIEYNLLNNFSEGKYYISPAIASYELNNFYDWRNNIVGFFVKNKKFSKRSALKKSVSVSII